MPAISPTASLRSSESSVSSCSDISVEANFYDRQYVEDSSTEEYSSSLLNGFHQLSNTGKHENGEIGNSDNVVPTKNVEVLEGAEKNAERLNLLDDEVGAEFWLPPEAEDHEDDITGRVANYEDDDEFGDGVTWANPSSPSSFGEGGCESYKLREEKIKAMENVRNGKFRNLVRQLVKSVGIDYSGNCGESWVDIVTNLSWEAAAFVKPDMMEGKAMDPDGYVKIKCIASGLRTQSRVIKGLVFKKHAAHKHMPTNCKNPRLLLIHGSLDLSSDGLSSFQAMTQGNNNLKSIVDMIEMYHPNVVLVEKSVSGDIQESILAKGMTLVFDMKLHRLERVARCIGSPILSSEVAIGQKLRQCDSFHIEKFVEEHVSTEAGKKQRKTLMFLEGSPSRLGCTILLMGANSDELKRIKCVVRCAVVMAYHLMLETSFLLDQSSMFSTISKNITSTLQTNVPNHYDPNAEENNSCTLDIPISNGFHEIESENLIPLPESDSSLSFESYNHETFPGLSLSTSIQEVMSDSFPLESSDILNRDSVENHVISKDEISAVLDSESILVLMWSRNASKGTMCKQSRFYHIKFYRDFDVPLGKYLQENLLNQGLECKNCGAPPEVHVFYYAHRNKQLTIQVRKLPAGKSLSGETEGKLWMWSRCGLCKFHEGSSNSTRRVLISTTTRGLSFGKFLELSFSNNFASDSPSSCGHSFQKDFLYFFGLGPMIAMFKYSTVATYTVSLPPQRMEYKSSVKGEFLKKDIENVHMKGMSMFLDIEKCLKDIATRYVGVILNIQGSSKEFSEIVEMLEQEKSQFEVNIQSAVNNDSEDGLYELLTLNRIRLELLLESCIWDRRLHALLSSHPKTINADSVDSHTQEHFLKEGETEQEFSAPHVETDDLPVREIQIDRQIEGENHFSKSFGSSLELKKDKPMSRNHSLNGKHPSLLSNLEENDKSWIWAPLTDILREYTEDLHRGYLPKIESFSSYPLDSMAQKMINDEGSRLHIPLGSDNTSDYIVSDYEDEFSSIIACALALLKDIPIPTENLAEYSKSNDSVTRVFSFNTPQWSSFGSMDSDSVQSPPSKSSSFDGVDLLDSLVSYSSHPEVSMGLGKFQAKRKYSVVCLFASQFRQLRGRFCSSEVDYIASLSRCRNWDAKGGKSKSFFAKTLDDRFIIKEIKRTEFDSFVKFATNYFDYMNDCYELGNQTCLAKILGIYQVVFRATKNGKETKHDLLIMENLSFGRHIARQYDLKGAMHARFSDEGNKPGNVLLDQNFVNDMNVSPLYISRKSKQNLQRAVYNDTNFLNANNVMDYSLLVGVDTQRRELTCGIIDYLRQYTWDKQLENWVKTSLVVPKNTLPTIISPIDYKTRFRKFINTHFLSVPDHWCSQRSSNPCKLCGSALQNGSVHKKCQKRVNQDDDPSHGTSQKHGKHEDGSLKSSNHGEQNGIFS